MSVVINFVTLILFYKLRRFLVEYGISDKILIIMDRFNRLKEKIGKITNRSEVKTDYQHSLSTREWVLKFSPDASEELQIAALAHDIDRAVPPRIKQREGESYANYKQRHAGRSARIIADLMRKHGYEKESIEKVFHFVENHEIGGDTETSILTDADSISYFADNIEYYFKTRGVERTKSKIKFMFERVSDRAKREISKLRFKPPLPDLIKVVMRDV